MDELFKYFMQETKEDLHAIKTKLSDLQDFKVKMVASARLTSLVVSIVCGAITLLSSLLLVYYTARAAGTPP